MRKKLLCLAMTAVVAAGATMPVYAEDYQGHDGWLPNLIESGEGFGPRRRAGASDRQATEHPKLKNCPSVGSQAAVLP